MARRAAWAIMVVLGGGAAAIVLGATLFPTRGDPGRLEEPAYVWPDDQRLPVLTDVTADWGLSGWANTAATQLSGGVSFADLDRDGDLDVVLGGGTVTIFYRDGDRYLASSGQPEGLGGAVIAVQTADVDGDGWADVLVGTHTGDGVIMWGGPSVGMGDLGAAETTPLPAGKPTTALLVGDVMGSPDLDVVRLAYGSFDATDDVILEQVAHRVFVEHALPASRGFSLAGEIADIGGDRGLDIWVTRDLGWKKSPDSLYVLSAGRWVDEAFTLATDLAIDGMSVTLTDIDTDGFVDAYVADLGDNEVLLRRGDAFQAGHETGAARIRPPGSPADIISISWGTGVADVNLDGIGDLIVVNGGFPGSFVENKIEGTTIAVDDPPAILLGLGDGRFVDVWPQLGLEWAGAGRGLGLADLDGDGDTDVVAVRQQGGVTVYRNDTPGRSVTVVTAAQCRRHGAVVRITGQAGSVTRMLTANTFLGSHAPEVIAGIPRDGTIIQVTWPDGSVTRSRVPSGANKVRATIDCKD